MDVIRGFTGDDVERAVYYPEDDRFLLTKRRKFSTTNRMTAVPLPSGTEAPTATATPELCSARVPFAVTTSPSRSSGSPRNPATNVVAGAE